ncbi:MAG TPA: corrinoid protein [Candidatus Alistipes cottocaccae]|nr:corrinoid protein [Candidatus Alistipes cottocaccae]
MKTQLDELYNAILTGNLESAVAVTEGALAEGVDPQTIINNYMIRAMEEIGRRFEAGQAYVPNLLMSARAMKGALELLRPLLRSNAAESRGRIVIGTVRGDLHDIGKNLVASMLEGCGFEVYNIGVDISSEKFLAAAREHQADIICMSALLTTTMTYMKEVIDALRASDLAGKVKTLVGGAPVSEDFARSIGADGYSSNANNAVQMARQLLGL